MNTQDQENVTVQENTETQETPAQETPAKKNKPAGRLNYFTTKAAIKTRILYFVALALGLAFAITLFASGSAIVNTPLMELPAVDMFVPEETKTELADTISGFTKEIDKLVEEGDEEAIAEVERQFNITVEELKAVMQNPSIQDMADVLGKITFPENEDSSSESSMPDLAPIFDIIISAIVGIGVFFGALALLSIAFLKKGLLVFVYIISSAYAFLLVGMTSFIILTISAIAYFVITTIINQDYKSYKRSF